jgi:predicted HTH transcriptional regulator
MTAQFRLGRIAERLEKQYVPRRGLDDRAAKIVVEIAKLGSLERGSVRTLLNVSGRTATNLISSLIKDGIGNCPGSRLPPDRRPESVMVSELGGRDGAAEGIV